MKRVVLVFLILTIVGCQKQSYVKPDLSLNENNASRLIVYRPKSDWIGIAIDYKVFAGEIGLGSLSAGGYVDVFIPAKKTIVKVQGHFLGFADGEPVQHERVFEQGKTYYLRFVQRIDNVFVAENTYTVKGGLSLMFVEKQDFETLK